MLVDSELDAVLGGATAGQTGGEIVVKTPAPAPQGPIPTPYGSVRLGGVSIDGAYLYAPIAAPVAP